MHVVLHIGVEKTGTTSIQTALDRNRQALLQAGWYVPEGVHRGGHRRLAAWAMDDDFFDDFFQFRNIHDLAGKRAFKSAFAADFGREMAQIPAQVERVIISNEHLQSRLLSPAAIARLKGFLARFFSRVSILCYVREQGAMLVSAYSSDIKWAGKTCSLESSAARCHPDNLYFNHHAMLSQWASCFGHKAINVRRFERNCLVNGRLLEDFFSQLDPALPAMLDLDISTRNAALDLEAQLIGRALNMAFPDSVGQDGKFKRALLHQWVGGQIGVGRQLDLAQRQAIYDRFEASNRLLARDFLPGVDCPFARPVSVPPDPALNEAQLVGRMATLLRTLYTHDAKPLRQSHEPVT